MAKRVYMDEATPFNDNYFKLQNRVKAVLERSGAYGVNEKELDRYRKEWLSLCEKKEGRIYSIVEFVLNQKKIEEINQFIDKFFSDLKNKPSDCVLHLHYEEYNVISHLIVDEMYRGFFVKKTYMPFYLYITAKGELKESS